MKITCFFLATVLFFTSCVRFPPEGGREVPEIIQSKIGKEVYLSYEDERVDECLNYLLSCELTADSAVQIALLKNPRIQETLWEIGIAQADLIEAGLLSNPFFDAIFRFPHKKGFVTNTEFSIAQNFIDIFLIPLKTKVAAAELETVKFQVAHKILDLSFDVETTYYELIFAQKKRNIIKKIIELAETTNQIATAQATIGNIDRLQLQLRTSEYLKKTLELTDIEIEVAHLREKLNTLLGLSTGLEPFWCLSENIPDIYYSELNYDCLESIALNERLDLQAARWEVERFARVFPTTQWWTFSDFHLGISSARDPDPHSPWTTGPIFSGKIPIFNYGQATRKRYSAQFHQAKAKLAALEMQAFSEVREARSKVLIYRNQVLYYSQKVLPNQKQILNLMEELYNIMAKGIYELLDAKQNELTAILNYQTALKNYWVHRINLDRAVGGKLYLVTAYSNSCGDNKK